jgi:NADH:ubiquinone oxidoreductase subunit E
MHKMIVTMLAEGHPVWYVAAMVNQPTRTVESIATRYSDTRRLRRAAHHLRATAPARHAA